MNRIKIAAVTIVVAAVSTVVPLGITGTAHASTSADGCTVRPYAPTAGQGTGSHGRTMVDYTVEVTCVAGVDIEIDQDFWEQDLDWREGPAAADDEYTGTRTKWLSFSSAGTVSYTTTREIPSTGPVENETEEVYQDVQFEVSVDVGNDVVLGGWTAEELTQPTELHR